jgi:hypothetical protein
MSVNILIKRSDTPSKRPDPNVLLDGELALNFDAATGGLYYKDTDDNIVKVGPCQVSPTAPNSTPGAGGSTGNSLGEFWFNSTSNGLFVWNGTVWVDTTLGVAVQSVSGTSPIVIDNTDPLNPIVEIDAASTTQAGAVQLNDTVTSTSTTEAATANAVKTAYDQAAAAIPDSTFTAAGELIVGTGAGTYTVLAPGAAEYILQSNGDGTLSWVVNSSGDVTSVSGTAPIQVDNTDPQTPIVSVDVATTSAPGVVQVGTNIDVSTGTISVANSSTTVKGVVQLNNTTNNSSTDLALTAAQGKSLQDQIDALSVTSNLTFAGTFDTSVSPNGEMVTVSAAAAALTNPFVVGDPLPTPAAENAEFFVIITTGGDYGPTTTPVSTPPFHVGDWFLSNGTAWEFLNLGFQSPAATTTVEGVVYLATDVEVQAGTDTGNKAVNPASLQAKVSDSTSTTDSFAIASSTAVKSAYDLADAALPKSGGTMTGAITAAAAGIVFDDASTVVAISDSVSTTSSTTAASATAVKAAYDAAIAAGAAGLPTTGGTMTGNIIFSTGTTVNYADTASTSVAAADQLATVVNNSNGNLTIISGFDAGTY